MSIKDYKDPRPEDWEDRRLPCDDEPYPVWTMLVISVITLVVVLLAGAGFYHLFLEGRDKPWKPSDVNMADLRGAAKHQAKEGLK